VLVGREPERRRISALLAGARLGEGAAVLLVGEAGIGKTALLDAVVAGAEGMRVLRATGTEAEADVPFGGLLQLLRPVLGLLDRLPEPQATALARALDLRPGAGGDRFAVGTATLSLLSRAAEDRPLLVVLDDAHLLDTPSAQALLFAGRRLTADPVAMVAAVREGREGLFREADLPGLPLAGLPRADAEALVTGTGRQVAGPSFDRLYAVTGGNPLALLELADEAQALGTLPPGTPVPVPKSVARAFARRADRLSPAAREALLVAAAGGEDAGPVLAAVSALGLPRDALEEAEDAGLLRVSAGRIAFRHDLVRSAVYAEAPAGTRRAAHRALAGCVGPADADRRAWHLEAAATGPDEEAALALEATARRARGRGAHAVAARASERAARLSADRADRARRLLAAAGSAWQAGAGEQAIALLERTASLEPDQEVRTPAAALRGAIAARTGSVATARDVLTAAAADVDGSDPDAAIELCAEAVLASFVLVDAVVLTELAGRLDRLAAHAGSEQARWLSDLAAGVAGVLTGRGGPERIRAAVLRASTDERFLGVRRLEPWLVLGPLFLRESGTGRVLVGTVVDTLRRRSDLGGLPFLLFLVGRDQATRDRWDLAEINYAEGAHLARESGSSTDLAACLAGWAWLNARQGDATSCRAHAAEALRISGDRELRLFEVWSLSALGELELARGEAAAALEHLTDLDRRLADMGLLDVDLSPAPELVEAWLRTGHADRAADAARRYAAGAEDKGQPWSLARAERSLGLVAPDDVFEDHFERALAQHADTPDVFETARTRLVYGARLRRARRRVDARGQLRPALSAFESLGAAPWADRAAAELRATGVTAQRRNSGEPLDLTPQERQIAGLLAAGRTTKETAAALFLSPKTVEYHLRHVYQKLGIGSRAELAARLWRRPDER
jgi:DNA-binding CsgD family transcriptional regulator